MSLLPGQYDFWRGTRTLPHIQIFAKSDPERPLSRRLPHFPVFFFWGVEILRRTGPIKALYGKMKFVAIETGQPSYQVLKHLPIDISIIPSPSG
jgi:hypothetical protein